MSKKIIFFLSVFILAGVTLFYLHTKNSNPYNTIGGVKVTINNLHTLVPKAPGELAGKVRRLFKKYPEACGVLVKQHDLLTDVGKSASDCSSFFDTHKELKNIGGINYIFKMPSDNFLIKISGPSVRLYNTAMKMGLGMKTAYFRRMYKPGMEGGKTTCDYVSFDQDKQLIKKYFCMCVPESFLQQKPTREQLKQVSCMVCGALAYFELSGIAEYALYEKFLNDLSYDPKTIEQALHEFLDCAFESLEPFCYKKSDIADKTFADTYNVASRVFHMARFNEAIDKFGLNRLEKPPVGYVVNVNPNKPYSYSDKDVVFVQRLLKDFKSVNFYMKSNLKHHKDEILYFTVDREAILQLCKAIQYSGLWDINGDNIFINEKTKKIMYIDFEHNRDVTPCQLFNGDKEKVNKNFCEAVLGLLRLFGSFNLQKEAVYTFVKENNFDLEFYKKEAYNRVARRKKGYNNFSPLGWLLCYEDTSSEKCERLKQLVYTKLKNAS